MIESVMNKNSKEKQRVFYFWETFMPIFKFILKDLKANQSALGMGLGQKF